MFRQLVVICPAIMILAGCGQLANEPTELTKVSLQRCEQLLSAPRAPLDIGVRYTDGFSMLVDRTKWDALTADQRRRAVNVQAELTACKFDLYKQTVQVDLVDALDMTKFDVATYQAD